MSDEPVGAFASAAAWEAWLAEHHATEQAVIVKIAKKASGIPTVSPAEAIEVALCFGWIDGVRRGLDGTHFLQRFTPRRARSKWSKINRAKAIELIEAGRMRPAGLAEVERAKADGRWDAAYDSHSTITEPDDLRAALDANPQARAYFDALDRTNRYAILYRLHDAKKPQTRQRRLEKFVAMCAAGEKLYP